MDIARAWRFCLVLGVCFPGAAAHSQLAELQPGARVRIRAPAEIAGRMTGVVIARTTDSVTITRPNAAPLAVALSRLTSLEVSRGKSRLRGAGKGTLWGMGSGVLIGLTPIADSTCSTSTRTCTPISRGSWMGGMVFSAGIVGAAIGAIVGSENWDSAVLPTRVALLPPSRGQSSGIMLSWAVGAGRPHD